MPENKQSLDYCILSCNFVLLIPSVMSLSQRCLAGILTSKVLRGQVYADDIVAILRQANLLLP